jgi:hypothetical protein
MGDYTIGNKINHLFCKPEDWIGQQNLKRVSRSLITTTENHGYILLFLILKSSISNGHNTYIGPYSFLMTWNKTKIIVLFYNLNHIKRWIMHSTFFNKHFLPFQKLVTTLWLQFATIHFVKTFGLLLQRIILDIFFQIIIQGVSKFANSDFSAL